MKMRGLSLAGLIVFFCSSAWAESGIRVGRLQTSDTEATIVIGVEETNPAHQFDFNILGFTGEVGKINPKFFLDLTSEGITQVRSFESESLEQDRPLLDLPHLRRNQVSHALLRGLGSVVKNLGFPFSTSSILGTLHGASKEKFDRFQAYYLLEILNQTLPPYNHFPELKEAVSADPIQAEEFLRILGEAILVRYNPKNQWAGLNTPVGDPGFFEQWRNVDAGKRSENKGYLVRLANERDLSVISCDDHFAIVYLKPTLTVQEIIEQISHLRFMGLGLDKRDAIQIHRYLQARLLSGNPERVPWFLVSFTNATGPVDLANFISPKTFDRKLQKVAREKVAIEIGGSLIPFSHLITKAIRKSIAAKDRFLGKTTFLNRTEAYGAILALSETRACNRSGEIEFSDQIYAQSSVHMRRAFTFEFVGEKPTPESIRAKQEHNYQLLKPPLPVPDRDSGRDLARGPASIQVKTPSTPDRKPVILFLIDGLRPDRFREALRKGQMPNLAPLYSKNGIEVESYASRSLTLPSWGTILTGFEPDVHGIRSNTPASRLEEKISENFADGRKDILNVKYWVKNRAFRRLEENQVGDPTKVWLPGYFNPDQVFLNYMPIVNGPQSAFWGLVGDYFKHWGEYQNDVRFHATALDAASADMTARAIHEDSQGSSSLRLIVNWYSGVDEASHYNNRMLPSVYREIDLGIGKILDAARQHPILKDATVFVLSDHGHTGGFGPFNDLPEFDAAENESPPLWANTAFNVTKFLAGDFLKYPDYRFVIGAAMPPEPKFDLSMQNFLTAPYRHVYPMDFRNPTALVDCSGDNMAQISLRKNNRWDRLNYFELTHFETEEGKRLNLIADLVDLQLPNLMVTDPRLVRHIQNASQNHPVGVAAIPLFGEKVRAQVDALTDPAGTEPSTREPILVVSRGEYPGQVKTGLILTRSTRSGKDYFRYAVVRNFRQAKNGAISAELSYEPADDPLRYLGFVEGAHQFNHWRSDRNWLHRAHDHPWPTAIFAISRMLTLSEKFTHPGERSISLDVQLARQAETPDILLVAQRGFSFQSAEPMESDHGGLSYEEVQHSFFVSALGAPFTKKRIRLKGVPVLNRDVTPTVLDFAGVGLTADDPFPLTQGMSIKPWLDAAVLHFQDLASSRTSNRSAPPLPPELP